MYTARLLSRKQDKIKDYKGVFKPLMIPLIIICLLVLPANLSTSFLIFFTAVILMFIGRVNMKYLMIMLAIILILLGSFIAVALSNNWENGVGT